MSNYFWSADKTVPTEVALEGTVGEMISNVLFQEVSFKEPSVTELAEIVQSIGIIVSLILQKEL
jgi:hypothetical protein